MTERFYNLYKKHGIFMIITVMMLLLIVTPAAAENVLANWTETTSSPEFGERYYHTSVAYDGKMWVIGGRDSDYLKSDVWYSTDGVTWTQATSSAEFGLRYTHGSLVYDGKMWVIGGREASNSNYKNDVWYSTNGVNWTQATASAAFSVRDGFNSFVYDGKMWVIGGYTGSGYKNDVWYSTDGVNWTQATASPGFSAREYSESVVYDGKMWVIGGCGGGVYNDAWYSTDGVNWTQATASAEFGSRYNHVSVVYDGKMWVIGGSVTDGSCGGGNDVWYSTDGVTWIQETASAEFGTRYGHSSVVHDGKMWVIGGPSDSSDVWYASAVDTGSTVIIGNGSISEPGLSTTITLTLDNAPEGLSGYNLNVSLDDTSIAEITGVSFPGWAENMSTHGTLPAGLNLLVKASDTGYLVESGETDITLATLTLKGLQAGSTGISISGTNFDDDDGDDILPSVITGTLTVDYTPTLLNITPSSGYNNGSVNITLEGSYLMDGASVNLTRPGSVITAVNLSYVSDTQIDGVFNLTGQDEGTWNVTVTNPDGKTATITDGFTIVMPLVPVNDIMPADPDGDGKYEDLNGNGQADYADVNIFFVSYSWIEENEPADAFDFNDNGRLDMADIVALFDSIS